VSPRSTYLLPLIGSLALASGCGTLINVNATASGDQTCKPFGGVRFDAMVASTAVPATFDSDPASEFRGHGALLAGVCALGDFPFTLVGDVVTLPYVLAERAKADRTEDVTDEVEALNRLANDREADPKQRAKAVLKLFAKHVRVGNRAEDMRRVLLDTSWLSEANVSEYGLNFSGWNPVEMSSEDRVYVIHLFSPKPGDERSHVYIRLAGRTAANSTDEAGLAFLRGQEEAGGGTFIKEFAVCYPEPWRIDRFETDGTKTEYGRR
jgi:hypothetical protein